MEKKNEKKDCSIRIVNKFDRKIIETETRSIPMTIHFRKSAGVKLVLWALMNLCVFNSCTSMLDGNVVPSGFPM